MARPWSSAPTHDTSKGRGSAPPSDTCRPLARDHAAPEPTLALAKAVSLGCGRVPPLAWCSRPRDSTASLEGALLARIAGVNLPNQKRLEIGLTYIYGIGQPTAREVAAALGLNPDTKIRDLTDEEVTKLRQYIDENLEVEGDLRRDRSQAIKRLSEIGAYRGIRHRRGLPVNGQRTRTNARTRKGPKKTVGRGKRAK